MCQMIQTAGSIVPCCTYQSFVWTMKLWINFQKLIYKSDLSFSDLIYVLQHRYMTFMNMLSYQAQRWRHIIFCKFKTLFHWRFRSEGEHKDTHADCSTWMSNWFLRLQEAIPSQKWGISGKSGLDHQREYKWAKITFSHKLMAWHTPEFVFQAGR